MISISKLFNKDCDELAIMVIKFCLVIFDYLSCVD